MVKYKILIDGVDYTSSCALPFKEQYVLDSALDNGVLNLFMIPRKDVFKPFTPITITKDSDTYTMYVASDKVTEIVGTGKYNHDLVLIEETKLLEKKVVDTNTTTQPLVHDYLSLAVKVQPTIVHYNVDIPSQDIDFYNPTATNTVLNLKSLDQAYSGLDTYPYVYATGTISVEKDGVVVDTHTISRNDLSTEYTYTLTETGVYTVRYYAYMGVEPESDTEVEKTYTFQVIVQPSKRKDKSITDVVNRLLAITETLRASETPALVFNQEQADFYGQRETPSWYFKNNVSILSSQTFNVNFTSNGVNYSSMTTFVAPARILYDNDIVFFGAWQNDNYRKIQFNEEIPAELQSWLNANAIMVLGEPIYPAPEFSMTKSTLRECLDQVGSYIHSIVRLVGNTIYFDKLGGTETYKTHGIKKYVYYINEDPNISGTLDVNINFIANNTNYSRIHTGGGDLWYNDTIVYSIFGDPGTRWRPGGDYRTITFYTKPTGDLQAWLSANATIIEQESGILDTDYIGHYETLDAEQYASQLDSIVSNLTNIDDEATGTIIEPFRNAYKTVRAESGTITINDTSAIIETDYPIEKIAKLECGYITVGGTDYLVGDITPYVYEKAEYDLLSSNSGTYPLSKGYAITYTQGQPNITGLTFKLPNSVSPIFSKPAILNIISQKLGINVQTIFNVQDITELQFRLTYYPSTTARVEQSRTDINNYSMELTSIYNQSANKVDSRAYGENLKGAIARLGNIEKFITYELSSPDDLPNVGEYAIIDNEDYYIATLSVENQIDHTKVTVGLSKDFNALSKYIGIKNNIRLYEVSEKQSVERHINYKDYCVIGNPITSDNKQLVTGVSVISILGQFTISTASTTSISVARVQGTDIDEVQKEQVDLPVISLGLGNTIWIGFKYADNYSAGNQSVNPPQGDTLYRLNQYVPYADYFGELETLKINMYSTLQSVDSSNAVTVGNALPVSTLNTVSNTLLISTQSDDLVIKKDSREQINFAYQMHYVTNDNIIIGTQLAQGCPLVSNFNETYAELYVLPNRINKFASNIDLTNATLVKSYNNVVTPPDVVFTGNSITFGNQIATASGKSWAMVDKASGKLLFGKNIAIENGEEIEMPTMTFTHKY